MVGGSEPVPDLPRIFRAGNQSNAAHNPAVLPYRKLPCLALTVLL
jgi:hypothetical protein